MFGAWKYLVILGSLAAILTGTHWKAYSAGKSKVMAEWQADKLKAAEAFIEAQKKARAIENDLQAKSAKIRQEHHYEIKRLHRDYAALVAGLRDRSSRSAAMSQSPGNDKSRCTGAELYREDAEFLAGLAREADEIRAALSACYRQYDEVVKSTNVGNP